MFLDLFSDGQPNTYGDDFVLVMRTTGEAETVTIPCRNVGVFDAVIDWGDGSTSEITAYNDADLAHEYAVAGDHEIRVSGSFPNIYFNNAGDKLKLIKVLNLGNVGWNTFAASFYGCGNLVEILNSSSIAAVTSFTSFCHGCDDLVKLDLSLVDMSDVTAMNAMFYGCAGLTALDVSGFDTAKVTNMYAMFRGCGSLTALDVSGFDTAKVTDMSSMFRDCGSLTALDVSGFNTSQCVTLNAMFYGCAGLTALDVSGFDTAKVTDMSSMFRDCAGLTALDVSGFDTAKVTIIGGMFRGCASLTSLDLAGFDIEAVTNFADFMVGTTILTSDYDGLLVAWDAQDPNNSLSVNFGGSKYTAGGAAAAARASLISGDSWTITDGGTA
jgi:surface protein